MRERFLQWIPIERPPPPGDAPAKKRDSDREPTIEDPRPAPAPVRDPVPSAFFLREHHEASHVRHLRHFRHVR